jgi:hypothetical protein
LIQAGRDPKSALAHGPIEAELLKLMSRAQRAADAELKAAH